MTKVKCMCWMKMNAINQVTMFMPQCYFDIYGHHQGQTKGSHHNNENTCVRSFVTLTAPLCLFAGSRRRKLPFGGITTRVFVFGRCSNNFLWCLPICPYAILTTEQGATFCPCSGLVLQVPGNCEHTPHNVQGVLWGLPQLPSVDLHDQGCLAQCRTEA